MTEDEKLDFEAMEIREEMLISQERAELACRCRSRHRFWFWLTVYMAYWGHLIYALVTGCPFFFGDLTLIQQLMGFITVIFAPFMPVTYYFILGILLTTIVSYSFDKLQ